MSSDEEQVVRGQVKAASTKNPPPFSAKRSYDAWTKEFELWKKITKVEKKEWGALLVFGIHPKEDNNLRDRILSKCKLEGDGRYLEVIKFLDDEYKKDTTVDMCDHMNAFMEYTKKPDQSIKAYIQGIEQAYHNAKNKGMPDLPHQFLMSNLIRKANLSDHDRTIVLDRKSTRLNSSHSSVSRMPSSA